MIRAFSLSMLMLFAQLPEAQQESTPDGVVRASQSERTAMRKGPTDWKLEAREPKGPVNDVTSAWFEITLTNLSTHDSIFTLGPGLAYEFQFREEVTDQAGKVIQPKPYEITNDDCSPCMHFLLHPADKWHTKERLPPWYLKGMRPGTYWVRFSKYDSLDHTTDWSNKVRVAIAP